MPQYVCLCCRWNALDIHNEDWLCLPLPYQHFMFLSAQNLPFPCSTRRDMLHALNLVIAQGICPGVVAWCNQCETITALVDSSIVDLMDAIMDVLHRHRMLQDWVDIV